MIFLRYVPHARVSEYTSLGWTDEGAINVVPHGFYSSLMRWEGESPPEPASKEPQELTP